MALRSPHRLRRLTGAALGLSLCALSAGGATAQEVCGEEAAPDVLRIGVRSDARPFSYRAQDGGAARFAGYTVGLCAEFAEALRSTDGTRACFREVDPQTRFRALDADAPADLAIDMLCGATTATLEVRRRFETSLYTFLTATTYLHKPSADLSGGAVVGVRKGTTSDENDKAWRPTIRYLETAFPGVALTHRPMESHDQAARALASGDIDIYVADRPILTAILEKLAAEDGFRIDDGVIVVQPYAVVFPKRADANGPRSDLAFRFNRFLIERKFAPEHFAAFRKSLVELFGADLDVGFLRIARIQGAIPIGELAEAETAPRN
ncbi:transporter substrate-binding domain-containing protein [Pikeienuella piscinae]|uniref:Transporter substrate-binding domain-containing protein n=1 Tax=Pikeienuella piscinae TaxID=2748098 RepID=A0A7L5BWH5_9RHOB|nr:transporter substrate-binding domain-containing protein [Pikeienuella piscinae]QIE56072.1 transporter substrate-binding domain-containing protein [Pikeienuella piscinae]